GDLVTGVQTCALPICLPGPSRRASLGSRRLSLLRRAAGLRRPDRHRPATARLPRVRRGLGLSPTALPVLRRAVRKGSRTSRGGGDRKKLVEGTRWGLG